MISRYYSYTENATYPEAAAEILRKFGHTPTSKNLVPGSGACCVDCGLGWTEHSNFYCFEPFKGSWKKPNPYCSVADGDNKLVAPPTGSTTVFVSQSKENKMKPYAVIAHNLADPNAAGAISGSFETQEAAQEFAEAQIAQGNANLTVKTFRTLTILNTKTGQLVGANVQAPPTVDWGR